MTTTPDPLTAPPGSAEHLRPDRPFYAAGVLLDAPDFTTEQLYHRGRLARSLAYLHGSGTVSGLRVNFESALEPGTTVPADPSIVGDIERVYPEGREARILVQPGLAIDRLGRLIELSGPACLRLAPWLIDQKDKPDTAPGNANDETKSLLTQATHPVENSTESTNISSDRTSTPITVSPTNRGIVADIFIRFTPCETGGKTPAFGGGPFDTTNANVPARIRDSYELSLILRTKATADLAGQLPRDPWAQASNLEALHNQLFDSWQETTNSWTKGLPNRLPEHADNQDTTSLFLARLLIIPGENDAPPTAQVDNFSRQFVYPSSAIAHRIALENTP